MNKSEQNRLVRWREKIFQHARESGSLTDLPLFWYFRENVLQVASAPTRNTERRGFATGLGRL